MILVTGMTPNGLNVPAETSNDDFLSPQRTTSSRHFNGSESNLGGMSRINSNRRFNGSSVGGVTINPSSSKNGLGTEDEHRNLMAETKFRAGPPRTPRYVLSVRTLVKITKINCS